MAILAALVTTLWAAEASATDCDLRSWLAEHTLAGPLQSTLTTLRLRPFGAAASGIDREPQQPWLPAGVTSYRLAGRPMYGRRRPLELRRRRYAGADDAAPTFYVPLLRYVF